MDIILKKEIKKKVIKSRKYFINNSLDLGHKLLILQVFSGIKPAASFDYLTVDEKNQIVNTLREMGIYFKIIKKKGIIKIIFGKKDNVDRLIKIHDSVFTSCPNKKNYLEYGRLLGYPPCCIRLDLTQSSKGMNPLFNRFSGTPLIFHSPCSNNCKKSIQLAKKVLAAYTIFDKDISRLVLLDINKPILRFDENLFAKFENYEIRGNKIGYSSVDVSIPSSIDEPKINKEDVKFIDKLNEGDSLQFSKDTLTIFMGKKQIITKKFRNHKPYSLLNMPSDAKTQNHTLE